MTNSNKRNPISNIFIHETPHLITIFSFIFPRSRYNDEYFIADICMNYLRNVILSKVSNTPITVSVAREEDYFGISVETLPEYYESLILTILQIMEDGIDLYVWEKCKSQLYEKYVSLIKNHYSQGIDIISSILFSREQFIVPGLCEKISTIHIDEVDLVWEKIKKNPWYIVVTGKINNIGLFVNKGLPKQKQNLLNAIEITNRREITLKNGWQSRNIENSYPYVMLGMSGFRIDDQHKYSLHVLWTALTMENGSLFKKLRSDTGFVYALKCFSKEYSDFGQCIFYCLSHKLDWKSLIKLFNQSLMSVVEKGMTPMEITMAKNKLIQQFHLKKQRSKHVHNLHINKLLYSIDVDKYPKEIELVTKNRVSHVAEHLLTNPAIVVYA